MVLSISCSVSPGATVIGSRTMMSAIRVSGEQPSTIARRMSPSVTIPSRRPSGVTTSASPLGAPREGPWVMVAIVS